MNGVFLRLDYSLWLCTGTGSLLVVGSTGRPTVHRTGYSGTGGSTRTCRRPNLDLRMR